MKTVEQRLRALADPKYREFQSKLIPTVAQDLILGVRTPDIRKLAKGLDVKERAEFLGELPHRFYDENILHAAILCSVSDFAEAVCETERFLPYIDNWAVCDLLSPKCFSKLKGELLPHIRSWMQSERTYTVRFGTGMLMKHFLDADFEPEYLDWAASVRSEEYYVNMMTAWFFATALAKQYDCAVKYIEERRLGRRVHAMAIQKALESFRVTEEHKEYLRTLKQY